MKLSKFQRCLGLALALLLTAALPVTALADTAEPKELVATDVTLDETRFQYTGQEIRPNVTVRVDDQLLTLDRDYTLEFQNNVEVGTAAVVVTGIATAGYTGTVEHPFYIEAAPENEEEETEPTETQPEESKPEETTPEESKPEESQPEETQPVSYKITKGNGASWHKSSGKNLSFTADGDHKNFTAILVDGKKVNSSYYTVAEGTVVTLDSKLLQSLALGKHTVKLQFADGEASGTFTVSVPADDSNPKTGDDFAIHAWTAILFMSLTGMIGIGFVCRKKFRK